MAPVGLSQVGVGVDRQKSVTPVKVWAPPQAGDLVFGAQGLFGFPVQTNQLATTVNSGYDNMASDFYLPAQPANWRVIFAGGFCIGNGDTSQPLAWALGNDRKVEWGSLFSSVAASTLVGDVPFTEFGQIIPNGGHILSDPLPAVSDGAILRAVVSSPQGAKRLAGRPNTIADGTTCRRSPTLSTFDSARTGGALSGIGSGLFNNEAEKPPAAIVRPMTAGEKIYLLIGTSITRDATTDYTSIVAARDAYSYAAAGLDSAVNGRRGFGMFAINGATIARQDENISTEFGQQNAILKTIKRKNGGRDGFTDIILDFRNDLVGSGGVNATDAFNKMLVKVQAGIANIAAMFPGCPIHIVDAPPMSVDSTDGFTTLSGQTMGSGNYDSAGCKLLNAHLAANYASMGLASVIPAMSACATADDGSGFLKWRQTDWTAAGGGTLVNAVGTGVNMQTTGVLVASATPPRVGDFLVLDANVSGSLETFAAVITSAVLQSAGQYLVKLGFAHITAKAHSAGAVVRTAVVTDRTHPSHACHQNEMKTALETWKGTH